MGRLTDASCEVHIALPAVQLCLCLRVHHLNQRFRGRRTGYSGVNPHLGEVMPEYKRSMSGLTEALV